VASNTWAAGRPLNRIVLAEVALLGGMATLLIARWLRGQLSYYIHPRYSLLVAIAGLVLLLMAVVRLRSAFTEGGVRPGWGYLLLATPLLLGVLIPARPLGADTLATRGTELNAVAEGGRMARLADDTSSWNLLDWGTALSVRGEELAGSPADVVGFVFHDDTLGADSFYAVRYVVTCCAADGAGVGLPVLWDGGGGLPADSWVRVRGKIEQATVGGYEQLALRAESVEPVPEPENPYLYP
jgi:putative membrane protein